MKKVAICLFTLCCSQSAFSQIPTTDAINAVQNTIQAMESVTQTANQITGLQNQVQQIQYMLQNTKNPGSFNWQNAQSLMYKIKGLVFQIDTLKGQAGGMAGYLNNYQDTNFYRNAACNSPSGCTPIDVANMQNPAVVGSAARKKANDAAFKGLDLQQQQLQDDANHLAVLQSSAQSADGQMKALQAANQLLGAEDQQLMQIRSLMVQEQQAAMITGQMEADKQAQQTAASLYARQGNFYSSPSQNWILK